MGQGVETPWTRLQGKQPPGDPDKPSVSVGFGSVMATLLSVFATSPYIQAISPIN